MDTYYSLGEIARLLGVAPYRIVYRHTTGRSPEPERLFGNRAYRWPEIVALAEHFGVAVKPLASEATRPAGEHNPDQGSCDNGLLSRTARPDPEVVR